LWSEKKKQNNKKKDKKNRIKKLKKVTAKKEHNGKFVITHLEWDFEFSP
jgi:hypothetical protein